MKKSVFTIILIGTLLFSHVSWAEPFKAVAAAEKTDLSVGEPFIFQIQVSGSDSPEKPDLSHLTDFNVVFQGGQQNSSRSVTIINGKVVQEVHEGYVYSYQLTPKRQGRLEIPSITVNANGKSTQTESVVINVHKPVETKDFKLRLKLSKDQSYVGEPVILTVTWYIGKDVKDFNFTLPILDDNSFKFANPEVDTQSGKKLYHIPLGNGQEAIGEQGRGQIDGKEYTTITFKKVLFPMKTGDITIEPATVTCSVLAGYQKQRSPFGDSFPDFNDFFNDRIGVYRTVVVPSNALSLHVLDLPKKGRPDNFAGHIGEYKIDASAKPTEVNVGDPITLTITLSGPDYLENVTLPPLSQQPALAKDFKIPHDQATGEVSGKTKVFTQTIRALRPDVKEIPPIELPYFDTRTKTYQTAYTKPIPITVKATRIITALDAEGKTEGEPNSSEIETWGQGIAFNYEGMDVIENQRLGPLSWFQSPLWISLVLVPPFMYFAILSGLALFRRRNADQAKVRARKAYGQLIKALQEASNANSADQSYILIQNAFRHYLGDKLDMAKGALTFNDVKDTLANKGIDQETLGRLNDLFETCEAGRYAGDVGTFDISSITGQGIQLAKDLEKKLK